MLGLRVRVCKCVCVCVLEWGNGLLEQHSSGSPFHLLFPTDLLMDHATLSPFLSSDLPLCHSTPLHRKGHFTLCGGLCVCIHDCVCFKCLLLLLSALLLKQGCWCLGDGCGFRDPPPRSLHYLSLFTMSIYSMWRISFWSCCEEKWQKHLSLILCFILNQISIQAAVCFNITWCYLWLKCLFYIQI